MDNQKNSPDLRENKMGVMPVGKLLVNMALPMIISMLVQAMYNVVDSIYVSQISESAVTALSLAFPVQNMQIAFAGGIAVGVNSLLSKSLGENNPQRAAQAAGNGVLMSAVSVAVFMLFGALGAAPFFQAQSNVAETVQGGTAYVRICCLLTGGIFVEILFERLLQASGRTVFSMITQAAGAIINIVLDPVFIFGWWGVPAMGIAGAAVATVIGQWVAAGLAVFFNFRFNPEVRFGLEYLKPNWKIIRPIMTVGLPSIVMMAIGSVMNFSMNQILQGFTETATGVFGIYYKLQSFFFMPVFGLNNATISILAFNYGARKPQRILHTLRLGCAAAFCFMTVGFLAFRLTPELLLEIFNPSEEFLRIGCRALRIISFHFPLAAFGIVLGSTFQALGVGIYSTITSLCRQMLALLPAAWLLSLSGELNLVWWAFPIAEVVSLAVTVLLFLRIYRQKLLPILKENV
jgi:putative MATE family efflux protein